MITQDLLKQRLNYDDSTGKFYFRLAISNMKAGEEAGAVMPSGYRTIKISGKPYYAHRLAWLYVHGAFPDLQIDHINGVKGDNRLSNLRVASEFQNGQNQRKSRVNTSGFKGVSWNKKHGKWRAYCAVFGKQVHLGLFLTAGEAARAVSEFRLLAHGEFANHGVKS